MERNGRGKRRVGVVSRVGRESNGRDLARRVRQEDSVHLEGNSVRLEVNSREEGSRGEGRSRREDGEDSNRAHS